MDVEYVLRVRCHGGADVLVLMDAISQVDTVREVTYLRGAWLTAAERADSETVTGGGASNTTD